MGLTYLIITLVTAFLLATNVRAEDHSDLVQTCTEILQIKESYRGTHPGRQILKLNFKPAIYGAPVTESSAEDSSEDSASESTDPDELISRNIIFSFAPGEKITQPDALEVHEEELEDVEAQLKSIDRYLFSLSHETSVVDCVERAQSEGYDPKVRIELQRKKLALIDAQFSSEEKSVEASFKRLKKRLHLSWKWVSVSHLDEIHQALLSPGIRNVMIVTHSQSSGQIMDSYRNGLPPSFFDHLSSSLQSLSIYSCHGDHVKTYYHLHDALGLDSEKNRLLFTAKESEFLNQKGVAPVPAFRAFLARVDRALNRAEDRASVQANVQAQCSLVVKGFTATKNDFAVMMNGDYIGTIRQGESGFQKMIPCQWIAAKPVIFVRTLSIFDESNAKLIEPKVTLQNGISETSFSLKEFHREDGTLSTLKAFQN